MDRFINSINKQIEYNLGKNLFFNNLNNFKFINHTIDSMEYANDLNSYSIRVLVDYATNKAIEEFCRINQYYTFNSKAKAELRNIYSELFTTIKKSHLATEEVSKDHFNRLKSWLIKYNPFAEKLYAKANEKLNPVECSEYSSLLQINILQIDITNIKEPVMDIGCGKKGNLVKYFCANGIQSYGIDRFAFNEDNLMDIDWLEYDFGFERWGTIVSNLGFSNHFKHHHLRNDGNYVEYAKKYMEILKSLKLGGSFYYAPDLPFIEQYLNRGQYCIDKVKVGKQDFCASIVTRLRQ